jgi:broad specificity phosphatase PhoE
MIKIYVARHGQNVDNANGILNGHRDEPLTALGETQARTVGEEILKKGLHFDYVYSSPLQRALMTAEIICEVSGQPAPVVDQDLIERNFGVMSGKKASDIESLCAPNIIKTDTITYFLNPEGAETFPDLIIRADRVLERITFEHKDGSVLLVGHGDFGKMLYAAFYKIPWEDILVDFHYGNSEVLYLAEDSAPEERRLFKSEQFNY